ncbi:unnamed protein product, partial [Dovyalis caffra]
MEIMLKYKLELISERAHDLTTIEKHKLFSLVFKSKTDWVQLSHKLGINYYVVGLPTHGLGPQLG